MIKEKTNNIKQGISQLKKETLPIDKHSFEIDEKPEVTSSKKLSDTCQSCYTLSLQNKTKPIEKCLNLGKIPNMF